MPNAVTGYLRHAAVLSVAPDVFLQRPNKTWSLAHWYLKPWANTQQMILDWLTPATGDDHQQPPHRLFFAAVAKFVVEKSGVLNLGAGGHDDNGGCRGVCHCVTITVRHGDPIWGVAASCTGFNFLSTYAEFARESA